MNRISRNKFDLLESFEKMKHTLFFLAQFQILSLVYLIIITDLLIIHKLELF